MGVIGSGVVGQSLARGLARYGHEVRVGTREPDRPELADYATGTNDDVAQWAEVVFLGVHGEAAVPLAESLRDKLAGKVVVDATNPLDFSRGGPGLFVGIDDSLGERVQRAAPEARVVKAYNTVGNALFVDPELPGGPPTMPIAGNDDSAKRTVTEILTATGWDVIDLGGIEASRWLEPFALAWVVYGLRTQTWTHAFKLLRSS